MSPTSQPPENPRVDYSALSSQVFKVGALVGITTLLIILAAVFGGLWLDRQFATRPLFTILLVVASAPVSLWLTFRLAKRAVKPLGTPPRRDAGAKIREGDQSGE